MNEVNLIITKMNGEVVKEKSCLSTDKLIDNINDINFINSCGESSDINKQIVKVNIIHGGEGFPGCTQRNIEYNLNYNEQSKCYVYM
ncbi:hypothetical protein [uncultured Clostridium sp.]|uniref:hypothetical protein n=1 Tax=uncultured Clostridium sp. TaxID=59620 RepID=UPI0028F0764D|nr:hypothetical protein [uncultured Clostridium sp.]